MLKTEDSMCPTRIHSLLESKMQSSRTCETRSLTDSEGTDNQKLTMASLIGKVIHLASPIRPQIDCCNAFKSIHIDASFNVLNQMSTESVIDMTRIYHLPSYKTNHDLRPRAIYQLLHLPVFYNAILFLVGGLMFVLGECASGNSVSIIQNIYLAGSSLYFCGSLGIIFEDWMTVHNAWNLLQDCQMELHAMAFSVGAGMDFDNESKKAYDLCTFLIPRDVFNAERCFLLKVWGKGL